MDNKRGFHMYPNSSRMLPDCITPTLHKMHITSGQFEHRGSSSRRSSRGRRSNAQDRTSLIHPQNFSEWSLLIWDSPEKAWSLPFWVECVFFIELFLGVSVCQEAAASGPFLSDAEYSVWVSKMKLADDEAQPTLRQSSSFLSLPHDVQAQVCYYYFF